MSGGGDSSSSSANTTTTSNTDKRQVVDNGAVGVSSDSSTVNVQYTDQGSVAQAIDLVKASGVGAIEAYKALLATTLALESKNSGAAQANVDLAGQIAGSPAPAADMKKALMYGGLAIAGIVAVKSLKG